mgnify:CR=1 FL=1
MFLFENEIMMMHFFAHDSYRRSSRTFQFHPLIAHPAHRSTHKLVTSGRRFFPIFPVFLVVVVAGSISFCRSS